MKKAVATGIALMFMLALTACGGETITQTVDSLNQAPQKTEIAEETNKSERTVSSTMLRNSAEVTVYLEVSDTEIGFWDSASGGQLLTIAKYPETITDASDTLTGCDYTDLDEDGNSDLTANFTLADGSTASLVWFYMNGGFVYNKEFSLLPGDVPAIGSEE